MQQRKRARLPGRSTCVVTASEDTTARVWNVPLASGTLVLLQMFDTELIRASACRTSGSRLGAPRVASAHAAVKAYARPQRARSLRDSLRLPLTAVSLRLFSLYSGQVAPPAECERAGCNPVVGSPNVRRRSDGKDHLSGVRADEVSRNKPMGSMAMIS